jgi:uncharacterized protein involved in exopolysaccharide biosynthesis
LIDLIEFARYYRRRWKVVLGIFCACMALAVLYFLTATPVYRAQVTLQFHATSQQTEGLGSTLGLGLALAGLQGEKSLPERAEGLGILKSRAFLLPFIEKMKLAPSMFPDRFDPINKSLRAGRRAPSAEDLHRAFLGRVMSIDDNFGTGLITISIFMPNAAEAADVANTLTNDLNEKLRRNAVSRANANISYLEKQLDANPIAEIRVSIAQLIQSEMRRLLLANGESTQTFQLIDPAIVPDRIYAPRVLLITAFALLSAFLLSVSFALISFLVRSHPT